MHNSIRRRGCGCHFDDGDKKREKGILLRGKKTGPNYCTCRRRTQKQLLKFGRGEKYHHHLLLQERSPRPYDGPILRRDEAMISFRGLGLAYLQYVMIRGSLDVESETFPLSIIPLERKYHEFCQAAHFFCFLDLE